jgi:hypothetical protein
MDIAAHPKHLAVLLNDAFADRETAFLTASARDFFAATVLYFTPEGNEVHSEGGMRDAVTAGEDARDARRGSLT